MPRHLAAEALDPLDDGKLDPLDDGKLDPLDQQGDGWAGPIQGQGPPTASTTGS